MSEAAVDAYDGGGAAGGGAGALTPAVSGQRSRIERRAGPLSYYVAGEGRPLLLIHSINAAGSAYEVRPIFEAMREHRRVYAVDLPGFGFSDRSRRRYDIALYTDAVHDMLDIILERDEVDGVDALALSLSSEFLARATVARPDDLRSLTFVTPTGFDKRSAGRPQEPGRTREIPGLHGLFTFPVWSRGFFDLLTSKPSIRFFLKKTFGSERIDEGLFAYDVLTARQPGARHAPYAFVSGRLFSADIRTVYEKLRLPVWVPHATRGDFLDFSGVDWARDRANWRFQPFPTGALPHFEERDAFISALRAFLDDPGPGA